MANYVKMITTDNLIERLLELDHVSEGKMLDNSDTDPTYKPEIPSPKKHSHLYESDDEINHALISWLNSPSTIIVKLRSKISDKESKKSVHKTTK